MVSVGVCAFVVCVDVEGGEEGDRQGVRGGVVVVVVTPIVAVVDGVV